MGVMVPKITEVSLVYSTVCSEKHQSSASLAFVREFPAQRASNAENISIWWRHDNFAKFYWPSWIMSDYRKYYSNSFNNHRTLAKSRLCSQGCDCRWSGTARCQGICKHSHGQIQVLYLQLNYPTRASRWRFRADFRFAPGNERRRYFVTTSLIGWAQTWNQPSVLSLVYD